MSDRVKEGLVSNKPDSLASCPFCSEDGDPVIGKSDSTYCVFCLACGCRGPRKNSPWEAIDAWNIHDKKPETITGSISLKDDLSGNLIEILSRYPKISKQVGFINLILSGMSILAATKKLGINEMTGHNWCRIFGLESSRHWHDVEANRKRKETRYKLREDKLRKKQGETVNNPIADIDNGANIG